MFFLVYVSSATLPLSMSDLLDLLVSSRENNARLGVTGMLLYKEGNFMQVLEGEENTVRALYDRIARDPRHWRAIPLLQGHRQDREFPDWSMGFRDLDSDEARSTPGYSEFLNTPLTGEEFRSDPDRCRKLLLVFKRSM